MQTFSIELHSFTMLAAVLVFLFFVHLCYIFTRKFIIIFIVHFIRIATFVGCHNYFVRCVSFLYIALYSILIFVTGSRKFNVLNRRNQFVFKSS